jgi:hypothetical protein
MRLVHAFNTSGRSNVITATGSLTSYRICSYTLVRPRRRARYSPGTSLAPHPTTSTARPAVVDEGGSWKVDQLDWSDSAEEAGG